MAFATLQCPKFLSVLAVAVGAAVASATAAESSGRATRELTTDRPDSTETPFTVEPGLVQLEMSAASWTRDRLDGVRTTEWELAPLNVRVGVTRTFEAGLFVTPHVHRTERVRNGPKETVRGLGDTTLRAKLNFWGNDGGATGFGVIADVKLPTAATGLGNDHTDFTVAFPAAFEVGGGWDGAAMTVIEWAYTDTRHEAAWTNTFSLAREIAPELGAFFELVSTTGVGRHVLLFNSGLTRRLAPNLQLDAGINIGVSRTAPDLGAFVGLARRF